MIKTAHDMGREYLILTHVWPIYGKVPRPILYCDDAAVLGAPFFMMQRVKGLILRSRIPKDLELAPSLMRKLSEAFVQNLIEMHSVDYLAAHLEKLGQPEGYVARQIAGWTRRYYDARTDDVPSIEKLASWLAEHQPAESNRASLIHNDYKYDNVVLDPNQPDQVLATLDWEMATIGDPLMDLGTTLGYWVDADDSDEWQRYGFGLTKLPGSLSRADLIQTYAQRTGADVTEIVFYYAYGLMKIAVIVQQIYHRYRSGLTRDPRFADLGGLVNACGNLAQQAIEKRRIDRLG
jgi:aminoglycoside phosphotransferase (APT) family kinase protein